MVAGTEDAEISQQCEEFGCTSAMRGIMEMGLSPFRLGPRLKAASRHPAPKAVRHSNQLRRDSIGSLLGARWQLKKSLATVADTISSEAAVRLSFAQDFLRTCREV